jgi:hypothetical protein
MILLVVSLSFVWSSPVMAECPDGKDCKEQSAEVYLNAEGAFSAGNYKTAINKAFEADASIKGRSEGYEKLEPTSPEADNYLFAAAATVRLAGKVDLTSDKPGAGNKDAAKNLTWAITVLRHMHDAEPDAYRPAAYLAEGLALDKKTSSEARAILSRLAENEAPLDAQSWVVLAALHGAAGDGEQQKSAQRACLQVASDASLCGVTVEEVSGIEIESGSSKSKKKADVGISIEAGASSGDGGTGGSGKAAIEVF